MSTVTQIVIALAIFRISYLLVEDYGPYNVFGKLRHRTQEYNFIDLDCFSCTSIYVSLPFALLNDSWLIYWMGYSAAALLIYRLHERLNQ